MHRIIVTAVSLGLFSGLMVCPARAAHDPGNEDRSNNGNGDHNRSVIGIKSPTRNHGYQHTSNGNSGGSNGTLNALCRKVIRCTMKQKLIIIKVIKDKKRAPHADTPEPVAPAPLTPAYTFLYEGPEETFSIRCVSECPF